MICSVAGDHMNALTAPLYAIEIRIVQMPQMRRSARVKTICCHMVRALEYVMDIRLVELC